MAFEIHGASGLITERIGSWTATPPVAMSPESVSALTGRTGRWVGARTARNPTGRLSKMCCWPAWSGCASIRASPRTGRAVFAAARTP